MSTYRPVRRHVDGYKLLVRDTCIRLHCIWCKRVFRSELTVYCFGTVCWASGRHPTTGMVPCVCMLGIRNLRWGGQSGVNESHKCHQSRLHSPPSAAPVCPAACFHLIARWDNCMLIVAEIAYSSSYKWTRQVPCHHYHVIVPAGTYTTAI